MTGYNKHKSAGKTQEVDVCAMVFDKFSTMVDSMDVDETNLGRWIWVELVGKEGHTTMLITAYQKVRAGKK